MDKRNWEKQFDDTFAKNNNFCSCYSGDIDGVFDNEIKKVKEFIRKVEKVAKLEAYKEIEDLCSDRVIEKMEQLTYEDK